MSSVLPALILAASAAPAPELPFRAHGGIPVIEVAIGEARALRFVVDTGARPCVLDRSIARRMALEVDGSLRGQGGAGAFVAPRLRAVPPIMLADGSALTCTDAIEAELDDVAQVLDTPLDGVLGRDFFAGFEVRFDHDRRRITRTRSARGEAPADALPLTLIEGRPYVTAKLTVGRHRDVPRRLLVDTGSMDTVADALLADTATASARATGLGAGATVGLGRFERVVLGPHRFENVDGSVAPVPLLGSGLLARFNLVIDYDAGWMQLRPRRR